MEPALASLERSVSVIRKELRNLRTQVDSLRHLVKSEGGKIRELLTLKLCVPDHADSKYTYNPSVNCKEGGNTKTSLLSEMAIGRIKTCFKEKNGTPRQPSLCTKATGTLVIEGFSNPAHSLEGLDEYSHIWLLFVFHKNNCDSVKAKVRPPRLNGQKVGVFASRSPHRPCPIGITLAKLEGVEGGTLRVSGIDLIDGTPVLDMKPFIPTYDSPWGLQPKEEDLEEGDEREPGNEASDDQVRGDGKEVKVALWLTQPPISCLEVEFLPQAEEQLQRFKHREELPVGAVSDTGKAQGGIELPVGAVSDTGKAQGGIEVINSTDVELERSRNFDSGCAYFMESFASVHEAREAIVEMLQQDPRSVYRRSKCADQPYKVSIDNLNLTCHFEGNKVTVVNIQPKAFWGEKI